jgi:hypothetical protein
LNGRNERRLSRIQGLDMLKKIKRLSHSKNEVNEIHYQTYIPHDSVTLLFKQKQDEVLRAHKEH